MFTSLVYTCYFSIESRASFIVFIPPSRLELKGVRPRVVKGYSIETALWPSGEMCSSGVKSRPPCDDSISEDVACGAQLAWSLRLLCDNWLWPRLARLSKLSSALETLFRLRLTIELWLSSSWRKVLAIFTMTDGLHLSECSLSWARLEESCYRVMMAANAGEGWYLEKLVVEHWIQHKNKTTSGMDLVTAKSKAVGKSGIWKIDWAY